MTHFKPLKIFVAIFLLMKIPCSYGADSLSTRYPSAVLVQLRSEHNRIDAMKKDRNYKAVEEVKKDAEEVRSRMILDFTLNFHYCPIHYYMDTNADLVKNKEFDGVLMNGDGTPVNSPAINSRSADYFIVYYGYAISQPKVNDVVTDKAKYTYDADSRPGKGLVILNDKFQQLDHFYKLDYDDAFFKHKKKLTKYYYVSKHYDIEYFPFAKLFEQNMGDKYARHRIDPRPQDVK